MKKANSSPEENLMKSMMELFNKLYKDKLSANIKLGILKKSKKINQMKGAV
jgi:hypothetical protein